MTFKFIFHIKKKKCDDRQPRACLEVPQFDQGPGLL